MPKKISGVLGTLCAGGEPPFNSGRYLVKGDHEGQVKCMFCLRHVRRRKDGRVLRHPWQLKDPNVKPGDTSTNALANLAARAFERTR